MVLTSGTKLVTLACGKFAMDMRVSKLSECAGEFHSSTVHGVLGTALLLCDPLPLDLGLALVYRLSSEHCLLGMVFKPDCPAA